MKKYIIIKNNINVEIMRYVPVVLKLFKNFQISINKNIKQ